MPEFDTERIKEQLFAAIQNVCPDVFRTYPPTFARLPCASFYEISEKPYVYSDDGVYLVEYVFSVDAWAAADAECEETARAADSALLAAGFERLDGADARFTQGYSYGATERLRGIRHKNMRYRIIV